MKDAVIFIPGIMGSVLEDDGKVIWPGGPSELVFPYRHMDSLRKKDLVATDIIRRVSISKQYEDLIESLGICGFKEDAGGTLRVLPYDWRKDNKLAADLLANLIDKFVAELGDECSITLLAHSMGGLVSRCYLESGLYASRPGFAKVSCLITMGTPHKGAPMALSAALGKEKRLFLSAEQVQEIANNEDFPALYQLLPPNHEPFAWNRDMDARYLPEDIYDATTANRLGLSEKNLAAARAFHDLLDLSRRPANVRYFFFAGTRESTTASIQLAGQGEKLTMTKIYRDDAGDGTVPFWSGYMSGVQTEPVGGEHGVIYQGSGLKFVLAALLGMEGVLAAAGPVPEITVNPAVVSPEGLYRATIDLPRGTSTVKGVVRLRRMITEQGEAKDDNVFTTSARIDYTGPEIDHLMVVLEAPEHAGIYKVDYVPDVVGGSVANTTLFVQREV